MCECGCGAAANPGKRFVWGHNPTNERPFAERFWSKVDRLSSEDCWLWTATINRFGYGYFDNLRAHRVAWVLAYGEIPTGEGYHGTCVLHRCDVRTCVNPQHLFLGSNSANMTDMVNKGRQQHGETAARARLTAADVREIRQSHEGPSATARRFGVLPCTISNIRAGRIWKAELR